jgi:hypothetical protein
MRLITHPLTNADDDTHDHATVRAICTIELSVFRLRRRLACHTEVATCFFGAICGQRRLLRYCVKK